MTTTATTHTLANMADRVYAVNRANGWFDDDRAFGDDIALLHSEVSEMFEAYRDHGFEDVTDQLCKNRTSNGWHDTDSHLCKPEGFGSEAADELVRLLDTDYRHHLGFKWRTLEEVEPHPKFDMKATAGEHIRILHALISYISPETSLSPTLAYLVAWTDHLEIDLQAEFERKLKYNATRGYKHGGKRL